MFWESYICLSHFSLLFLPFLCPSTPQVACMQLINALVTSPDDLDFRIHLRNEFLRCGLKKILPVSYQTFRQHMILTLIDRSSCVSQYILSQFIQTSGMNSNST